MKVTVHSKGVSIEAEGENQKEVFRQLASLQEVFGEDTCGCCGKNDLAFRVRNVEKEEKGKKKTYEYFEMHCRGCHAKLSYGCHQTGDSLFPKRKDDNNKWDTKHQGWVKYVKSAKGAAPATDEVGF